ncbi:MAG: uroporphyrinogen decarboxylase family protein [Candidatus Omnitrophota bacterium]
MDIITSRQRLLRTLKGEPTDRIAISLYEFDGIYDSWIHNHPEYEAILKYAEGKTDRLYFWNPIGDKPVLFLGEVTPEIIRADTWKKGDSAYTRTTVKTPRGEISNLVRQDDNIHTCWELEEFCKTEEDAEKVISLPYIPYKPLVGSFFELDKNLGESGIVLGDFPDALCLTVGIFGFSRFLMIYTDNPSLIFRLLNFFQERILDYARHLLEKGAVTLYRIVGPEYATPPYLSPTVFDELVTGYDRELIVLFHKYGARVRLHAHGKIRKVLASFLEMGIDATDPVEPPPDGDVTLAEARKVLGSKVTLFGNIEERLFEIGTKNDVEEAVRKAIEEGASGGPFVLCPTAMPLATPLDRKIQENIIHYIDCGLKYGKV